MTWADSRLLLLLWVVPVAALFWIWAVRRRHVLLRRLGPLLAKRTGQQTGRMHETHAVLWVLAFALAVVALARPRWGYRWQELQRRGLDIVIALDVSRSMDAPDVKPSRMERARREILDLTDRLAGDRVGLVLFAGGAWARLPLTHDYGVLRQVVKDSDTSTIRAQGTDLGAALAKAAELLQPGRADGRADRAIVVISDGEDQVGQAQDEAKKLAGEGIHLYTLGVGTPDGAPIPVAGGGFKKDRAGQVVLTRLDEDLLQDLARIGKGAYARSVPGTTDTEALYDQEMRGQLKAGLLGAHREKIWNERYQLPLALALALWLTGLLLRPRRRPASTATALLFALGLFAAGPARAADDQAARGSGTAGESPPASQSTAPSTAHPPSDTDLLQDPKVRALLREQTAHPDDLNVAERLGQALYEAGAYNRAEEVLDSVADRAVDPEQRARARYDAGLAAYQAGRLIQAAEHWKRVLDQMPDEASAKKNLAAVEKEIAARLQRNPPKPAQGQDQNAQQNQQQGLDQNAQQNQQQGHDPQSDAQTPPAGQPKDEQPGKPPASKDGTRAELPPPGGTDTATPGQRGAIAPREDQQGDQKNDEPAQGGGDTGQQAALPGSLSPDEAARLVDGVEEGQPRVVVRPPSRGGNDW